MSHLRFSIAGLMVSVGFFALACAAIRASSALWASVMFSLTLTCLAVATVLAICGQPRAAWAGMAVFGFAYMHFAFGGQLEYPPLATGILLDAAAERIPGAQGGEIAYYSREGQFQTGNDMRAAIEHSARSVPVNSIDLLAYRQIGHSIIGLLAGVAGAILGLIVASRNGRPDSGVT